MVENDENGVAGTEMTIAGENGNKESFPNGQIEVNDIATDGDYAGDDHDAASEEKQRKKRELPPLAYCRFIAGNPKLAFGKINIMVSYRRFCGFWETNLRILPIV